MARWDVSTVISDGKRSSIASLKSLSQVRSEDEPGTHGAMADLYRIVANPRHAGYCVCSGTSVACQDIAPPSKMTRCAEETTDQPFFH